VKLLTFETSDGVLRLGALQADDEERIIDLAAGAEALGVGKAGAAFSSMLSLVEAGAPGLALAHEISAAAVRRESAPWADVSGNGVRWRSPFPVPPQFRDCLMFEDHLLNSYSRLRQTLALQQPDPDAALADFEARGVYRIPRVWYERPLYYKANRFSFIGTDEDIVWPEYTEKLDFELEYACVLNSYTKDVTIEQARTRIFGYTIFNDVSARDVQSVEMQGQLGPSKGKDFDTGNILGPCIVTADSVDPDDLVMIARVNGKEWSRGNSGSAYWSFPEAIAHASQSETLVPGELLGSGTVGGGCGLELGRYLAPGDVIELEVEGIGVLRNRVTRRSHAQCGPSINHPRGSICS
jgi:2-keto-4-pentenoate hydratase/2-oxohepta-3-ene-1,7-dioic acid hydratase in catechol pathway